MDDPLYREIILEHWQHPQNFGVIKNADIDVDDTNPLCGDKIRLTVNIENGHIKIVLFAGVGCAISQASASLFTEEIKGQNLEFVKKIKVKDVLDLLGVELTPARTKCALLVYNTLKKGMDVYGK
jgi:nitrogen fixation NifU-like protein